MPGVLALIEAGISELAAKHGFCVRAIAVEQKPGRVHFSGTLESTHEDAQQPAFTVRQGLDGKLSLETVAGSPQQIALMTLMFMNERAEHAPFMLGDDAPMKPRFMQLLGEDAPKPERKTVKKSEAEDAAAGAGVKEA